MKDHLKEIVQESASYDANKNRIREYIQEYFLYLLYKRKVYKDIVFCGGTALRFLYKIKRFSEDLDFSLSYNTKKIDFEQMIKSQKEEFEQAGYDLDVKYSTETNVNNAFFRFHSILFDYGISPNKNEKLAIKIEIDTNPPSGGSEELTIYNGTHMFYFQHYNVESLFAGKLHALLTRKYTKGRDWYDLFWYMTKFKEIKPNFVLLNNAMKQTYTDFIEINDNNWKQLLKEKTLKLDINRVVEDVYRFLEDPSEKEILINYLRDVG